MQGGPEQGQLPRYLIAAQCSAETPAAHEAKAVCVVGG